MPKLTDEDLISICRKEEQVGQTWQDAKLMNARQKALNYYDRTGEDFTADEGQSSVVTSEFFDTVESVMPGMMRVFASGEEIAEFTPMDEQDEQAAKEATQYVPHVMLRENDGFRIISGFIKDALMYRLSVVTVDLEEVERKRVDQVEGWTKEQMAMAKDMVMEQGGSEVTFEVEEDKDAPMLDPITGLGAPNVYSGTMTITRKKKRVVIDNVAPEDLLVSPAECRDIDQASYIGYRKQVTSSDLREMGLSQDEIDELSNYRSSSPEEDQRQEGQGQQNYRKDDQRAFWIVVAYVRADDNGDGISEMLRVVYAHAGGMAGQVIERMEWEDGEAPITIGSVILMPHTIVGRSLFDLTQEFQDVGTAVTRGLLDNLYLTIRPRPVINGRVNILSVLDHTPGMPIQMDGNDNPANNMMWQQIPPVIQPALEALGYFENKRDQRTGTSRMGNNMDDDSLSDASKMTMGGTQILRTASQERQGLMAQTIGNTGFMRLYRLVYRAIKRCGNGKTKYWANDDWQECDPTTWPDDMRLVVHIGDGTGDKQMEQTHLAGIGAAQEKLLLAQQASGVQVLTMEHLTNTGRKFAQAAGYKNTDLFFPSDKDVKQSIALKQQNDAINGPPVPPEVQKEKAKAEAAIKVQQAQNEDAIRQTQAEAEKEAMKIREEAQAEALKIQAEIPIKQEESFQEQLKAQIEREKMDLEREKMAHERAKMEHERAQMQMDGVNTARDQRHERLMKNAATEQDVVDDNAKSAEGAQGLAAALKEHAATSSQANQQNSQAIVQMGQAIGEGLKGLAAVTARQVDATERLVEAANAESEVTLSSGKTVRSRKVPRK